MRRTPRIDLDQSLEPIRCGVFFIVIEIDVLLYCRTFRRFSLQQLRKSSEIIRNTFVIGTEFHAFSNGRFGGRR
jgi:hypothetical protein